MQRTNEAFVYMVTNDQGTVLYTGSTSDLTERIYFHQKGMISGFTKKYNVHKLVYFERYEDMASARKRELKGKTRAKKEAIIKHANPDFSELDPNNI